MPHVWAHRKGSWRFLFHRQGCCPNSKHTRKQKVLDLVMARHTPPLKQLKKMHHQQHCPNSFQNLGGGVTVFLLTITARSVIGTMEHVERATSYKLSGNEASCKWKLAMRSEFNKVSMSSRCEEDLIFSHPSSYTTDYFPKMMIHFCQCY